MKPVEKWQQWTFLGSLSVIAIAINVSVQPRWPDETYQSLRAPQSTPDKAPLPESAKTLPREPEWRPSSAPPPQNPPRLEAETPAQVQERLALAARRAAEVQVAQHEKYLARYLSAGLVRQPGTKTLAVAVAMDNQRLNGPLGTMLASHLKSESWRVSTSLFTPEFVADGLFTDVFSGSQKVLNQLELPKALDALLLARQTIQYSTNASLENVITASIRLEVVIWPVVGGEPNHGWTFTANGAGFKTGEALAMAEERLIKQLTNETNMPPTLSGLTHP